MSQDPDVQLIQKYIKNRIAVLIHNRLGKNAATYFEFSRGISELENVQTYIQNLEDAKAAETRSQAPAEKAEDQDGSFSLTIVPASSKPLEKVCRDACRLAAKLNAAYVTFRWAETYDGFAFPAGFAYGVKENTGAYSRVFDWNPEKGLLLLKQHLSAEEIDDLTFS